jgi:hypothetical protein
MRDAGMNDIDFDAQLLDPIYERIGIAAEFLSREGYRFSFTVLDKTAGVEIAGGAVALQTLRPAACVRVTELIEKKLDRSQLKNGRLTFNGGSWNVEATRPKPKPGARGEVYLLLQERSDD